MFAWRTMIPHLAHIYGPIWIQSYGFMIAVGLLIFMYLTLNDPRRKQLASTEVYINGCFFGLLCGVLGARILYALSYPAEFAGRWHEFFMPWVGGLTVIGAIAGVGIGSLWYFKRYHIPALPMFDLVTLYGPLLQGISRLGCLAAGCCYGAPAGDLLWAITFTHPDAHAPLFVALHPTQLYAGIASFIIFLVLLSLQKYLLKRPGLTFCCYLALENSARFMVDFWRGDRDPLIGNWGPFIISQVQLYALIGLFIALTGLCWLLFTSNKS